MHPVILKDKNRLQEIYDLRVLAYEYSPRSVYVNRQKYPKGWFDDLDASDNTIHWIIEEENKIIASARLSILDEITDTGEDFGQFAIPTKKRFVYWSRLVVHPSFRRSQAMAQLDKIRMEYIHKNPQINFAICCVTTERRPALLRLGFNYLGNFMYNWHGEANQVIGAYLYLNEKPSQPH